ncbi:Tn3 family transposase [Mesorhizobium helmanticense]|uniref:Tn3 family transposase n=1 Tax=Mesorhizobium helmanticense TaxID=1776423 RepID=UPI00142D541B|nr:Tn3 family transposase [Mesorhizobium helmanticense]
MSPVTAIYWNTLDIARVVDAMRAAGEGIPDHLLASLSPLDAQGFRPIQFTL